MRRKVLDIDYARKIIILYQRGALTTVQAAESIIEYFRQGLFSSEEADYLLENMKRLKKIRLV